MKMLIFAHGYDAPGVGAAITKILFEKDCKIDDFKIITLDDFFSLIVSIKCKRYLDKSEVEELIKEEVRPFEVDIKVCNLELTRYHAKQEDDWIPYKINIVCEEQTNVLFSFMKEMYSLKINIADIRCQKRGAGHGKSYQIVTKIEVPLQISIEILKSILDEIARNLNVLIDINPINGLEL